MMFERPFVLRVLNKKFDVNRLLTSLEDRVAGRLGREDMIQAENKK